MKLSHIPEGELSEGGGGPKDEVTENEGTPPPHRPPKLKSKSPFFDFRFDPLNGTGAKRIGSLCPNKKAYLVVNVASL